MMQKSIFLQGVLGRLKNDVGTYFDCVQEHNSATGVGVGFWGSVRLLMPVIEAISSAYRVRPESLLQQLGVKTPRLVWILYRHSLMHNDLLQHGRYNGVDATWGVSMFGLNHIIQQELVGIDTLKLYKDLVEFLERELQTSKDDEEVEIIRGVVWTNPSEEIKAEFELIAPRRPNDEGPKPTGRAVA